MSHYKPYSAYKDSGVEWIGMVPEHWEVMPVKFRFDARLGKMIQPVSSSDSDVLIPYHRAQTVQWESIDDAAVEEMWASPSDIKKFSVKTGDLLICEGGDVCRSAIVKSSPWDELIYQNSIHRVRAKDQYSVDWILRLMQHLRSSGWIDVLCNKNTIVHFTSEKLGALPCAFPSPKEASNIVDNLNRETTRIDTLIAKKTRFIELLKEKRQALITHAVTKGLDPNVKMKDTGVEWIGEVPEHWTVSKLKYVSKALIGLTYAPEDVITDGNGITVLRSSNIQAGKLDMADIVQVRKAVGNELMTQVGDILICSRNGSRALIGKNIQLDERSLGCTFGAFMTIVRGDFNDYLYFVFNSTMFDANSSLYMTSTVNQLTISMISDMEIPFPPESDQMSIISQLRIQLLNLDALLSKTQHSIDLLKERRSAFITAAVTGQIDLRKTSNVQKILQKKK